MPGTRLAVAARYVAILVVMAVVLAPFLWIFLNSFRPNMELVRAPAILPEVWTLDNYQRLIASTPFWLWTRNSAVVALFTVLFTLPLSICAAYSVYRCRYRGRNVLGLAVLAVYVFPTALLVVPIFGLFNQVGLLDRLIGLAVMNTALATPFAVWLLQAFLRALPPELEEAAAMDGAGRVRTIATVVLPQMAPGIFGVAVFAVIVALTEFLFGSGPLISDANRQLAVGMADLIGQYRVDWGRLMSGAVMTAAPIVLLFTLTARWFVRGISAGAVD